MEFFTKTLSSFTGGSIPYKLKVKVVDPLAPTTSLDRNSIWTLHDGINPKDNSPVSVFEFNLKDPANQQRIGLARNSFKKLKLIKFPGVISIIDFIENDYSLYIITEPVKPLSIYLEQTGLKGDTLVAGIYSVAQSISFINEAANSLYGGLNYFSSVFVTLAGDWKLMGFELLTNLTSDPDQPIYRLAGYMPISWKEYSNDLDSETIRKDPKKFDSYRFGSFIMTVFNNGVIDTNYSKLPPKMAASVKRLLSQKPNLRSTVTMYLKDLESWHKQNSVIKFTEQVNELKFLQESEKIAFFKHELPEYIKDDSSFPPGLLSYKLLPELINQYKQLSKSPTTDPGRQETLSTILDLTIKFGTKLDTDEFNKTIKPIIIDSFALADRSIRLVLLTHLPDYQHFLTETDIQYKIFNQLITGFQDTNFMIRETTLKSITIIIDKISVKQVNQELLRILAKSQMDPKPSIRVNTVILIIKISSKIYKSSKNNVLITALSKSLRDTFIPCKMTALQGFESLIDEFSLEEICSKILGHLAISLMDRKSSKVRKEAKRIFQLYLDSVESHANSLPEGDDDEDEEEREFFKKFSPANVPSTNTDTDGVASTTNTNNNTASSFGWGMVSKFTSLGGEMNKDFNRSTPDITRATSPTLATGDSVATTKIDDNGWDDFNDEWVNDEPDVVDEPDVIIEPTRKINLGKSTDTTTPKKLSSKPTPRKTTSLKLGSKATKPKQTLQLNLKVDDDGNDDNWGDGW
ncbi:protein kinase, putative [Candida dubliniensis CD36]|uniref:Protein kinase, putative n=1 Tax=Candida dubliniensis (strain CD36 / ATCC MYA-646 / CBS 7987 / NCPF 3949 / NRRL Y-17841) TaxID=573826 RepID=B9WL37_CANDC|nr:protein kinase, putative [Candida dubliniensis CD36]CAX39741.1 protein kinase, putative [Candida dubliniensis CD36]